MGLRPALFDGRPMIAHRFHFLAAAFAVTAGATTAQARDGAAQARLRQCGPGTCLVIEGRRHDPRATVSIAGHKVAARGGRAFSVALPLDSVRDWSAPFARTIMVRIETPAGDGSEQPVRLPIGLLGANTELAALEISAR